MEPKCTLRDAWMSLNQYDTSGMTEYEQRSFKLLLTAARGLVNLYDEHELVGISPNSAADQCSTLYDVLGSVGLPVE